MELLQLRYFCTVAELESITGAAKKYLLPQSSLSITVKKLENELGKPLFDRVGNRIRLNGNGRTFYQYARQAIDSLDTAVAVLGDTGEPNGEVRLLVLSNRRTVARIVAEFRRKYPLVHFSISHNFSSLQTEYDLCISSAPLPAGGASSVSVFRERLMLAVPGDHRFAMRTSVAVSELRDESFILLPPGNGTSAIMTALCRKNGFTPNVVIDCDDPYCLRKYVSAGLGVAFAPERSWNGLFDSDVRLIPITDEDAVRTTVVCTEKNGNASSTVAAFRDFLIAQLKGGGIDA